LKFVEAAPVSPTITENGPFLGIFLSETHAARSFQRDESMGLLKNDAFLRAIGDRRASAMELAYFDAPRFTARAYQTAQPYLPLLALFDRNLGGMAQSGQLPADVNWLAPIDVWAGTLSSDDAGLSGYSISGIGNQGVLAAMALRQALAFYPGAASSLMGWIAPAVPAAPPDPANPAALPPSPAPTNAAPNAVVPPTTHATPPSSGP
jgi:hypothetical protein